MNLILDTLRDWLRASKIADVPRWLMFLVLAIALGIACAARAHT